ncbi:MAG TPA: alpha/beta fold hydrolase [Polyangiaceae bacterium]|nr:alpha/beta fold hydrolase [Polyangiaceae bacterium]
MTLVLFAHGAGAPSSSAWMRRWRKLLGAVGDVVSFDYPYMRAGRKRPDPHETLVEAHDKALARARKDHARVVLAGKSMGGRIGCHLALRRQIDALVCLGYPLLSPAGKMRDEVLVQLRTPILFVQGTRDPLCPLELLEEVRARMQTRHALYVIETGDHSLVAAKRWLARVGKTQAQIESEAIDAITSFMR